MGCRDSGRQGSSGGASLRPLRVTCFNEQLLILVRATTGGRCVSSHGLNASSTYTERSFSWVLVMGRETLHPFFHQRPCLEA